ncbi:unannotated protein [freshwater metagenome]|uniref:Unannotated protein n=1 Tax=freshwater metagenome TaxID=449393 RepID=A0A6J7IXZ0_9ZZZZ
MLLVVLLAIGGSVAWAVTPRTQSGASLSAEATAAVPSTTTAVGEQSDPPSNGPTAWTARPATVKARRSDTARLALKGVITGGISPKSVASSGAGFVTAQNMMYSHTVTVYNAKTLKLVKAISDQVNLARLGYPQYPGLVRGAPVEAAFSPGGRYAYVSNYAMYGPKFGPEGQDTCSAGDGTERSFVYRIDMKWLKVDKAFRVGAVPKVVAVTPNDQYVLVANWCSWTMSVISVKQGRVLRNVPIGRYPRGIAVSPSGKVAYVAVMGGSELVRVDLHTWKTKRMEVGAGPRALVFAPSGKSIFVSLNAAGRVAKFDTKSHTVRYSLNTGSQPRSLALSSDGTALYVVNYESGTVTKLRARDMQPLQTIQACEHPIGITYEPTTKRVWVACYGGSIRVYDDR